MIAEHGRFIVVGDGSNLVWILYSQIFMPPKFSELVQLPAIAVFLGEKLKWKKTFGELFGTDESLAVRSVSHLHWLEGDGQATVDGKFIHLQTKVVRNWLFEIASGKAEDLGFTPPGCKTGV